MTKETTSQSPPVAAVGTTPTAGASTDPTYVYNDVPMGQKRPVRVISIGGGAAAINMAFQIKTHMQGVEHVSYEKNAELGGTWFENRYPGCACDIPSHCYQFSFEPYPYWKSFYSPSAQICEYMNYVVDKHDLRGQFRVAHKVVGAEWHEDVSRWRLEVEGPQGAFEDWCDVLINSTGVLNNWKWPAIEGIDTFKGHRVHTAAWDETYDYNGKTIAVIGVGSSAVQAIPVLQKQVKSMTCFIRSPTWITPGYGAKFTPDGNNFDYTEEQKEFFATHPEEYLKYIKAIEDIINVRYKVVRRGTDESADAKTSATADMKARLNNDPELSKLLIPDFAVGCRRPTPGDGFLESLVQDNVSVVSNPIVRITENGVLTADGTEHKVDALVCATGFDCSFRPRFPVIGRDGEDLAERWAKTIPEAYLSLMVDGYPNYFVTLGPSSPVAHGSLLPILERLSHYFLKIICKMQVEPIKSLVPRPEVVHEFNVHRYEQLKTTAWTSNCSSWFKNGTKDGPLVAVHPGSRIHFLELIKEPRYEDFEIRYSGNRFSFLGNGITQREVHHGDLSWYLNNPFDLELPY